MEPSLSIFQPFVERTVGAFDNQIVSGPWNGVFLNQVAATEMLAPRSAWLTLTSSSAVAGAPRCVCAIAEKASDMRNCVEPAPTFTFSELSLPLALTAVKLSPGFLKFPAVA